MSVVPIYYNSTFKHGVDEKRRLQIPSKWRPDQEGTELTIVVWPKHQAGTCLRVLPPAKMAKLAADIEAMPNGDPNKTILKRSVGSKSVQVALDKAGRICLPDEMAGAAGIKGEAVLVGLIDLFEIWNPARHEQVEAMDAVLSAKAFEMME
jgi:MraZ protein